MRHYATICFISFFFIFNIQGVNAQEGDNAVKAQETQPFVYDDHGKRDPFWELVGPGGTIINYDQEYLVTDLILEGIIGGSDGNIAIINGSIVKVNERVGDFIVQKIEENGVTIVKGSKKYELKIKKEE